METENVERPIDDGELCPNGAVAEHKRCAHIATQPFGIAPAPGVPPAFIGKLEICCRCGVVKAVYMGINEEGHGPFIAFAPAPTIIPASGILRPNGMRMETRQLS